MKILVSAGPTREFWDPVRFISNRSSGKMGYAIAEQAAERGHPTCLVSGPVSILPPAGVDLVRVVSAEEMLVALRERLSWCDALIMAAAVADWRPLHFHPQKLKKREGSGTLELTRTSDILQELALLKGNRVFVGFAAETENLIEEASRKLKVKCLDLIVANDVSRPDSGFEADSNQVVILSGSGEREDLPLMSKLDVARHILDRINATKV